MISVRDAKDPNDIDDFSIDWTLELGASETISTIAASTVTGDVVVGATSISGAITTARLSAGTDGTTSTVLYRITTSTGRQLDRTLSVPVSSQ